jgi:hypothetical protein
MMLFRRRTVLLAVGIVASAAENSAFTDFTRKRDKRKDSENCSEGNKETLDAGYDKGE